MRRCRFCELEISNASTVCEHCGRSLIPGRPDPPQRIAARSDGDQAIPTTRCRFCAEEILPAAVVCKHCGRDLAQQQKQQIGFAAKVVLATGGAFFVLLLVVAALSPSPSTTAPSSPSAFINQDWHPASPGTEVRWISDDIFTHVGGHCYARKTDGSTRLADGTPGLAPIAEKFCIQFGAKDTPFDVPDKR